MGVMAVLGVLQKVHAVLGSPRLQVSAPPLQPPTCGQDQRLDVLIREVTMLRETMDRLLEVQAAALQFAVEQAGPGAGVITRVEERGPSTMDALPEVPRKKRG